jgi:hypothetical protein
MLGDKEFNITVVSSPDDKSKENNGNEEINQNNITEIDKSNSTDYITEEIINKTNEAIGDIIDE